MIINNSCGWNLCKNLRERERDITLKFFSLSAFMSDFGDFPVAFAWRRFFLCAVKHTWKVYTVVYNVIIQLKALFYSLRTAFSCLEASSRQIHCTGEKVKKVQILFYVIHPLSLSLDKIENWNWSERESSCHKQKRPETSSQNKTDFVPFSCLKNSNLSLFVEIPRFYFKLIK